MDTTQGLRINSCQMAALSESGTQSFDGGSDSASMKELITPNCQTYPTEELLGRILWENNMFSSSDYGTIFTV